jgi:hypothetical protein
MHRLNYDREPGTNKTNHRRLFDLLSVMFNQMGSCCPPLPGISDESSRLQTFAFGKPDRFSDVDQLRELAGLCQLGSADQQLCSGKRQFHLCRKRLDAIRARNSRSFGLHGHLFHSGIARADLRLSQHGRLMRWRVAGGAISHADRHFNHDLHHVRGLPLP